VKETEAIQEFASQPGLRPWQHAAVSLFAFAVVISRRPDAIFHAQFYAEDGHFWFAEAYNLGWWPALFHTFGGYFQPLPRLVAALALLAPLSVVPLFFNLVAIFFRVLPVNLLLASRSSAWGTLQFRLLFAAVYLVLPNCTEVSYGLTNAQWPLALIAFLLLVAPVPQSTPERFFDILLFLLCGVTGPFSIFLLPIAIFLAWKRRENWRRIPVVIFTVTCIVQSWAMLFLAPAARAHRALGATPQLLARLLAGQVYFGALLGTNGLAARPGLWLTIFLVCVAIGGSAFVLACSLKSPMAMKLFLVFSTAVFAASLMNPFEWDHPTVPVWDVYAGVPGLRYWFFPMLAFAWALLFGFQSRSSSVKAISATLLCVMLFGIFRDWRHRTLDETNFVESVQRFEAASPGSVVTIPEQPQGWNMKLIKHGAAQGGPN
jgi:hypothetical protein